MPTTHVLKSRNRVSSELFVKPIVMGKLEIQIQMRKTLKPSTPTPNHLQTLHLSFFDQLAFRRYVPLLLHYLPTSTENTDTICCDKLQKSLAETLTKFYPLAGRFIKDDFSIHCHDEGVEYVETKVHADLSGILLHEDGPKIELLDDLLPWGDNPPDTTLPTSPLLGVQLNMFNCGGLVLGIQLSHMVADAFTFATFLKEWAHISLTGTPSTTQASFGDLAPLYPARVMPEFSLFSSGGAKVVTRRFVFDALAIAKLVKEITDSSATSNKPTRVVAVISLIWKVLVGISSVKHGHSRDSCLMCAVNLRRKISIPSLQHALGNFVVGAIPILKANQSGKELNDFVNLVGSASRGTSVGIGEGSIDDLLVKYAVLGSKDEMDIYGFTSWCRFPFYQTDFGWGKPFWVSTVKHHDGLELNTLLDTKDGEGIEAWLSLKENEMAEFERDPNILTFCPPQKQNLITQVGCLK